MNVELIGWASSGVLLLTIGRQVYTQWKTRTTAGLSMSLDEPSCQRMPTPQGVFPDFEFTAPFTVIA